MTVVNFEGDTVGTTYAYTNGDNSPTVAVVADPANSGQKSLQITHGGNGWNQAAIIPVYLPLALSNYEFVSFRFRLITVGTDTVARSIQVYAAANTSTFVRYGFGNPSSNNNNFAANLLGGTAETVFNSSYQGKWTDYTITIAPTSTTSNLQGNIFIAIGMNCNDNRSFMLDDITFVLKDSVTLPDPSISPTTANFNKYSSHADYKDIAVTMNLFGKTFSSITGGSPAITTSNYTVSGSTATLKKEYLAGLAVDSTTLTFNFSDSKTATIAITISDSTPPAGTILKYDFTTYTSTGSFGRGGGSTQALADTVTGKVEGNVLKVSRTSNNDIAWLWIPFNIGTDTISQYKTVEIMWKTGTGDTSYKPINIYLNTNTGTPPSPVLNASTIGSLTNGTANASSFTSKVVPISTSSILTGAIEIGVGIGQTNNSGANFEIQSIELKK